MATADLINFLLTEEFLESANRKFSYSGLWLDELGFMRHLKRRTTKKYIFMSLSQSDEDPEVLQEFFDDVVIALAKEGNAVYCSLYLEEFFKVQKMSRSEILHFCISRLLICEQVVGFSRTNLPSMKMSEEFSVACAEKKQLILIQRERTRQDALEDLAEQVYTYCEEDELLKLVLDLCN